MRRKAEERFGDIDFLLAFAGGDGSPEPIEELSEARWDSVISDKLEVEVLDGQDFSSGHEAARSRLHHLDVLKRWASALTASLAYSSAQAGVAMLARNLAQQVGGHGIRVNVIAPSAIRQ